MKTIMKNFSVSIKELLILLDHLSNHIKFKKFIIDYFKEVSEADIVKSYIWFLASIFEEMCSDFTGLNPFIDDSLDIELEEGSVLPMHYTLLCTNTIKGKYLFSIYQFIKNKLFKLNSLDDLFSTLEEFMKKNYIFIQFFKDLSIKISKRDLYYKIEKLIRPQMLPYFVCKDFAFYQSRFFRDLTEYLNFFKTEEGNWISSKGFFIGIYYSLFFIFGEKVFSDNKEKMILKEIPFENFSPEENGLYAMYSLTPPINDYISLETVKIYATEKGQQPLFISLKKTIFDYTTNLFELLDSIEEHKMIDSKETINIQKDQMDNLLRFLEEIDEFEEIIHLGKIFEYKNVYSLANDNTIRQHFLFRSLSQGLLQLMKNIKKKVKVIVLHILNPLDKRKDLALKSITSIRDEDTHFFLNNIPPFDTNIISSKSYKGLDMINAFKEVSAKYNIDIGYFLQVPSFGSSGISFEYWIGSFLFGISYYQIGRAAEVENFVKLAEFCKINFENLELKTYCIEKEMNQNLFEYMLKRNSLSFNYQSEFALFFSNDKEISQKINLDNYRSSFKRFISSFERKDIPNKEKKEALEFLSKDIFSLITEIEVLGMDIVSEAEEIDLLVTINIPLFQYYNIVLESPPIILLLSKLMLSASAANSSSCDSKHFSNPCLKILLVQRWTV